MRIFTPSKTFENISEAGAAVINLVDDPKLLAGQALKDIPELGGSLEFERSRSVNAPRLSGACAYVELEVESIEMVSLQDEIGTSEVAKVRGVVKNIEIARRSARPFRRVDLFLLESAVLATRALEALKRGRGDLAGNLVREIKKYREKCEKIAPRSTETEMVKRIENFLKGG